MSVNVSEIPNWLACNGILEAGVGNNTVDDGKTISDIVIGPVERYETDSEHNISRHQILPGGGIIAPISFFCSKIPNKDTFYKSRR